MFRTFLTTTAFVALTAPVFAQTELSPDKEDIPTKPKIYSPYAERAEHMPSFAEGVYWGDTHLHTSCSTDAGMMGNRLGPEEAFRFARGEEVLSSHKDRNVRIHRQFGTRRSAARFRKERPAFKRRPFFVWYSLGDSNPCYRRERAAS